MKTIIYGPVTYDTLDTAVLFGIEPTSYITNGQSEPPLSLLETTIIPIDKKVSGEPGVLQNHWRMVLAADALIVKGENDHLVHCAETYGLAVYQEV